MKSILVIKIVIGFVALSLGAIGLLLPVMPTTPFLLVAVGCFSSTPRIQQQVMRIPFVQEYYHSYVEGKGIRKQTLGWSLCFLWSMLFVSMISTDSTMVVIILSCIGILVTMHILYLAKRGKKDER